MQDYRSLFDLEDNVHYINCAYMSPLMHHVVKAGEHSIRQKVRPYVLHVEDFFDPVNEVRRSFSKLINNDDSDRIALIPSVSYGIANVTHNLSLSGNEEVIIAGDQFPSNVYPWMELVKGGEGKLTIINKPSRNVSHDWTEKILDAIDHDTRVVAISHTHWADGSMFRLEEIGARCREVGSLLIIDGTQSIGALPFDQERIQADAIICAGYKWLMGPYGIGVAYYGPWFDDKLPVEHNWINRINSQDFKNLVNYQPIMKPKGLKFSVGEQSNFILVSMLATALKTILDWGPNLIQDHCSDIAKEALNKLSDIGANVPNVGTETAHHLFGIEIPEGVNLQELKNNLAAEKIYVSFRGNHIRVSPHLYNSANDFELLTQVVEHTMHQVGMT